ncbi:MAG TPA: quinone-dependent dihydroorotate dehydrogenase [bacterium]|nr:quinone-dependent dihydroorotate dehydrogenase [bacterium]
MYKLLKPILFRLDPETAHHGALGALGLLEPFLPLGGAFWRVRDPRLERKVLGLKFPNPIGLAAGLDKKGERVLSWERLGFGFAELGTFTAKAQPGNDLPRVFRYPAQRALINRMGFPNPGARVVAQKLKVLKARGKWPLSPVGINIGKSKAAPLEGAAEDYLESLEALLPVSDYIAVNVSSPNTPGLRKLQDAKPLKKLLTALVRRAGKTPVLLKLAPDLEARPLKEAVSTALAAGCRGLIATNTTLSRQGLPAGTYPEGGLSGAPLRERSTQVLAAISQMTRGRVPLVAAGGVFTPEDVRRKMEAGASLVQVYTGFIYEGPGLPARLCRGLLKDGSTAKTLRPFTTETRRTRRTAEAEPRTVEG